MNPSDLVQLIFSPGDFEPHRLHFTEQPELLWFIVAGNALVALAYFLIPVALVYFIRKRTDIAFHWVFIFFAAFIFFCALTHIMHIVTFWYPVYWLQGVIDGATGIVSIGTALALITVIPQALKLPSPEQMRKININLKDEITKKEKAEREIKKLNSYLERRVKERTKELENALQQLQELEKRKDDFISMASHELKTPITSMNGYVYALEKNLNENNFDTSKKIINKVQMQINKQSKLVADLLDTTRLQVQQLQLVEDYFDINTLVTDTIADLQATTSTHTITVNGSCSQKIFGDKERISQVVNNFVTNALKFSPREKIVEVSITENKNDVVISVTDKGLGMDNKHLKKIFERFYRVYDEKEKTYPGMGVGLYIAKEIIDRHNGKIWTKSKKGQGSTFYFSLPFKTVN